MTKKAANLIGMFGCSVNIDSTMKRPVQGSKQPNPPAV